MTAFIILCAVLVAAAVAALAYPLLRKRPDADASRRSSLVSLVVVALAIPAFAALLYVRQSNWSWSQATAVAQQTDAIAMVQKLAARMRTTPTDVDGWLMLGRSYRELGMHPQSIEAFQKAFDLTQGKRMEATLGLAEGLTLADPESLRGRAGELFEMVLASEPHNPAALWYGAVAALSVGKLQVGRDRIARLLAQNPPQNIREILQRQLQDIDEQLAAPSAGSAAKSSAQIQVSVKLAPQWVGKFDAATTLFILARDPNNAGPPLAVVRRAVRDLPVTVTLSDQDAMMAGRGISSVARVQVVARISKSGSPQAQPGDAYGEAVVAVGPQNNIEIAIDKVVDAK